MCKWFVGVFTVSFNMFPIVHEYGSLAIILLVHLHSSGRSAVAFSVVSMRRRSLLGVLQIVGRVIVARLIDVPIVVVYSVRMPLVV